MLRNFIIALLIISPILSADQLVHVEVPEDEKAERILDGYDHPIFYEGRFILVLEADSWQPNQPSQTVLGSWKDDLYYFVLYPIRNSNHEQLANYGTALKSTPEYVIFETRHEVLSDFEVFHQFQLVRIFDRTLPRMGEWTPLDFSTLEFSSIIQQMVDQVSVDSIWGQIGTLQGMERYTTNPNAIGSSNYLRDYYLALGFDSVYFHDWHSGWIPNVIAVKYGKQFPDEIYVVGCHYDVYTNGAPGADDNASGTAAVMELGRVLSASNYKRTIKLIAFSGEELGLLGSAAYASLAAQQNHNILGMINMDMIAYVAAGDPIDVDLIKNTASTDLANLYISASQMYVPSLSIVNGYLLGGTSDHASFWQNGFKAIFPFEDSDQYSPYIHTSNDVLGVSANNQTLAELGTKSVVATVASLAEIAEARFTGHVYSSQTLSPIDSATIFFDSDSVRSNSQGYYITPPLASGAYTLTFTAPGFMPDTVQRFLPEYEVIAVDAYLIPEGSQRPYVHLESIVIDDDSSGGSLGNGNGIVDAGERVEIFGNFMNTGNLGAHDILATVQTSSPYVSILQDSVVVDSISAGGTALSQNAFLFQVDPQTPANTTVSFTLDISYEGYSAQSDFDITVHNRGEVLVVQDDNGAGGLSAYTTALDSLNITYDVSDANVSQDDMLEYDYMIWFCGDEYSSTLTANDQQKLAAYLDNGGKLFINGNDIGYDIRTDPFYSNYLKASYIGDGPFSSTTTAYGMSGDPISDDFTGGLTVNTNYVDQINPTGGSEKIFYYTYNGTDYGCGIKYEGNYQLVYLTFIFENIPGADQRELLMSNIFTWFGAITDIDSEPEQKVERYFLSQNYPNPFNPVTHIRFGLTTATNVKIEVFNVLGQRVATLFDSKKPAGQHVLEFDGSRFASGVYLYRIQAGEYNDVKKMILLK